MWDSLEELPSKWTPGLCMGVSQEAVREGCAGLKDECVLGELHDAAPRQGQRRGSLRDKLEK